jgi:hypothetical protein
MYDNYTTRGLVCYDCASSQYAHCGRCERYYRRYRRHTCRPVPCCEPQFVEFTLPGAIAPIANDTRIGIGLPKGEISEVGIERITSAINEEGRRTYHSMRYTDYDGAHETYNKYLQLGGALEKLGVEWQTKRGNYPKRLSRLAYADFGLKLSPSLLAEIGNIARDHSGGTDFFVEFTRQLNLPASQFVHSGSCWWTSYSNSRCAHKTNGGLAIRTFHDERTSRPAGRAWVLPLKILDSSSQVRKGQRQLLTPTFNTIDAAGYVIFNGYGNLGGYTPARIMAHMFGMTYRKVSLSLSPMYLNNGNGYLVGHEEIVAPYTDGDISLSLSQHSALYQHELAELNDERITVNA